ncbi:MAG TPA: biopolymer transporter ExbD [Chthoniobacterales bacterium]
MNIPSPRANRKARIEIVPLIDIIFFLLATFVMVSLSMVKNQGIPVNLPAAATSEPQERADPATVTLTAGGTLFFNKEAVTREQLSARLQALKASDPDPRVFINGDARAEFGLAVAVLDEARRLGILKVAIETTAAR